MKAKLNGIDITILEFSKNGRTCVVMYKSGRTEVVDTIDLVI